MNRSKAVCLLFCCLFFLWFVLSGCSDPGEPDSVNHEPAGIVPVQGGIYRMPLWNNPGTLDPARVKDQYGVAVVTQVFDGLVRFDSYLTVLPGLARTWQVEDDGKRYRFELHDNARFHNGDPVTAADVAFSISRLLRLDPPPDILPHLIKITGAGQFRDREQDQVAGIEIVSPKVLQISLDSAHMPFLTALGMYQASIVPRKEVLSLGAGFGKRPVGSGPFRFMDWDPDQSIILERFEAYYGGPAFLDGIHFKIYAGGQDSAVLAEFQQKKIDEMAVYGDVRETLADQKGLQWFHRPSLSLFFYGMNCRHPRLANPDFRKALGAAIDRTAFVKEVYKGQFDIARTILPPGMPGYSPVNPLPDNDPNLARQYLDQALAAGFEKVPELEIVSAFKTPRVAAEMEMIQGFWAGLGIQVRVRYITDWTEFEAYVRSDAVQLYRYAWFADMPDPDSILHPLFASDSPNNFMQYQDPVTDELLKLAREKVDPVERADIYQKTESHITASLPLIPLFYMGVDRVYQPHVQSIAVSALGAHAMPLNRVWLDHTALP
jgi:ABC-type transport system substrate-binding protein